MAVKKKKEEEPVVVPNYDEADPRAIPDEDIGGGGSRQPFYVDEQAHGVGGTIGVFDRRLNRKNAVALFPTRAQAEAHAERQNLIAEKNYKKKGPRKP